VVTAPGVVAPDGVIEAVMVDEFEGEGEKNRNPEGLDVVDLCILSGVNVYYQLLILTSAYV